jgi:DNA-binding CsgD family transcriptional regulator
MAMRYHNCIEELIKSIFFPCLVFDENNKVVLKNTVEGSSFKWEGEGPIGKTFFDLFPNDQASLLHDALQNAIDLKQPGDSQIRMRVPEGYIETTAKIIPFFNPDSNSWFMIFVIENNLTSAIKTDPAKKNKGSVNTDEKSQPSIEIEVQDAKAALRFLLKEGANQLTQLKEETFENLANQILPYVEGLKHSTLNETQLGYTEMLESNIRKLAEPFTRRISDPIFKLSPSELKVASMIRGGKSNKEMAKILNLSKSTILTHRHHIRAKLGLKNKKQNLRLFLNSLGTQLSTAQNRKTNE